ncbi:3-keto-disaccharide hydrolase [Eudoraea sp.]|uniref:3-keto-disaccharide hydrolase n=1 Tax=Eudoraea sp. TaxID=1979955 RepID=UPI003C729CA0
MKYLSIFLCATALIIGCKDKAEKSQQTSANQSAEVEIDSWTSLMNKTDWKGYNQNELPSKWTIEEGLISCMGEGGAEGGDIISVLAYDNFELAFEWKISAGGNSGVFYHVVESPKYKFPYETGPEFQLLDDEGFSGPVEDWQKSGANYAMHIPNAEKVLNPVGNWNSSRIIFDKGHVEHWLNGKKILEFDKNSEDWREKRNSGKWNDYPDYGNTNSGHFALQDHGAGVWFKEIKVKKL